MITDDYFIHNQPFHHECDVPQALSGHARQGLRRDRLGRRRPQPFVPGTCLFITVRRTKLKTQDNYSPFVSGKKAKTQRKVTALRTTNRM